MRRTVYLDACFVIYLIEDVPGFSEQARDCLATNLDARLCVSALTRLEVLTGPLRDGNATLVADYEDFLAAQRLLPITDAVFDYALRLRTTHRLKTLDALHLATAQYHDCLEFWTNDYRLRDAAGITVIDVLDM